MEPVTTTAFIATIVGYLAKTLKENKSFQDFTKDFTGATINWIRPLFLKDDETPKEALEKLAANPESEPRQKMIQASLETELEENPDAKEYLEEMYRVIKEKESGGEAIRIINSKNVVIGDSSVQGNFIVGDSNTIGK
ncbi:hypothetical protein [Emticicia sp. TH156]|uniref:hypothetical protein n=1 Tax=Emticicia sp. TH156 TaxID=2067454 RepID=UPI000CC24D8E|nr:hypothetical protein [Emticicia sp. TH156]PLK46280.1 hypothetical protein C0V77_02745 [Emticicia sp. TH156]